MMKSLNNYYKILSLFLIVTSLTSCKKNETNIKLLDKHIIAKTNNKDDSNKEGGLVFRFNDSLILRVQDANLSIVGLNKKKLYENPHIILLKDQNKNCISDGFMNITFNKQTFTIEQQNCSNKDFITEYITFKHNKTKNSFYLSRIEYHFLSKITPDRGIIKKTYDIHDFGAINFEDANSSSLYIKLINKL